MHIVYTHTQYCIHTEILSWPCIFATNGPQNSPAGSPSGKKISMTEAVIGALESALARGERPLPERLAEIAADARRLADPRRQRTAGKREADALWGHT